MKRIVVCGALLSLLMYSCKEKNDRTQMILGTWHSIKIDNPDVEDFFVSSQKYIDTVGKGNDAATNIALYGVANMDSMRVILQQQYDSVKMMQMKADTQTLFTFAKDSMAMLVFPDRTETGKWYIDADGSLVLEGAVDSGETEKATVGIVTLTNDMLKLKFVKTEEEVADTSYVTFRREGK